MFNRVRRVAGIAPRRPFTLIELMVVVAMMAILSGLLLPAIIRARDRGRKLRLAQEAAATAQPAAAATPRADLPQGLAPVIEQADLQMTLTSSYHRVGMEMYTRFEVKCQGRIVFRHPGQGDGPVLLTVPFPLGTTEARDVSLTLDPEPAGTPEPPPEVIRRQEGLYWRGDLPKDQPVTATIAFVALGRDRFEYPLLPARQLHGLHVSLDLIGTGVTEVPDYAVQPTTVAGPHLEWAFSNLVSDRPLVVEIPAAQSPLGRVLLLSRLVAIGVLLFGAGFWYLSEQTRPGQLDRFRWGHFLLLALTYSLFFVIFAVLSFHGELGTGAAMAVAAVCSLPLLVLHVARVVGSRFAVTCVLPLAGFTLLLVITGVYGGAWRDYGFIAATFVVIAYLTLTFRKWAAGRDEYAKQRVAQRDAWRRELEAKWAAEVDGPLAQLEAAAETAKRLLARPNAATTAAPRLRLEQVLPAIPDLRKVHARLSRLLWPPAGEFLITIELPESVGPEVERMAERMRQLLSAVTDALAELRPPRADGTPADATAPVHCCVCGRAGPPTPCCPECGARRPAVLTCRECGTTLALPSHLLADEAGAAACYCPHCGSQYPPLDTERPVPEEKPKEASTPAEDAPAQPTGAE